MNRNHLQHAAAPLAVVLAVALFAAMPGAIAAQPPAQLADSVVYSGGVDFQPNVDYKRAILSVSGGDTSYQVKYDEGERISIGMFDGKGQPLTDGTYRWRLELTPTREAARELRIALSKSADRDAPGWEPMTGNFAVSGGAIVDQEATESLGANEPGMFNAGTPSNLAPSSFGVSRLTVEDDDAAVGSRAGVEAKMAADISRQSSAPSGVLLEAGRAGSDDTDAVSSSMGRSLERAASDNNHLSAQSRGAAVPRPRSDGSNGRPRSDR